MSAKKHDSIWKSLGRRKSSIARVSISTGKGNYTINSRTLDDYFGRDVLKMVTKQPLELLGLEGKYDIDVNVCGGGLSGQAGAIRLGIARILVKMNADLRIGDLVKTVFLGGLPGIVVGIKTIGDNDLLIFEIYFPTGELLCTSGGSLWLIEEAA